jgi:pyruvate/2-oxoglutarate/acetoin dehydrogenase E1 component/TPP-dependent pyruvate/acetoin dehydrogenase alpha subunit
MAKIEESKQKDSVKLGGRVRLSRSEVISDYRVAHQSRIASLLGHKEVMTGKAKFGIFGDGKEVAQVAMARSFENGDWRAGYYRDQTFMFATGMSTLKEFFAQLYADPDVEHDPASGGRQMTSHFATRALDGSGEWLNQTDRPNSSSDISPTGGQMARLLGLAYASKLYRREKSLADVSEGFSMNGDEVAFGTIGNASTSEGVFFETVNAAGVLQVPIALSVWDDDYGISVPNEFQTVHSSISKALSGFKYDEESGMGFDIYVVPGWDYAQLTSTYVNGVKRVRSDHRPALFHIVEMTQPQGHSTSGSHERYKSSERLAWEEEADCIVRMAAWMVEQGLITTDELEEINAENTEIVERARKEALEDYLGPIRDEQARAVGLLEKLVSENKTAVLESILSEVKDPLTLNRRVISTALVRASLEVRESSSDARTVLTDLIESTREKNAERYSSYLHSQSKHSPLLVEPRPATYSEGSEVVHGRIVLNRCFEHNFKKDPRLFAIGEDIGALGGVNLVLEGLQERYGELRVSDTGIREATILGQGIGAAMRGLRPIVDIQYLDYLIYALQGATDDLATLHYRTRGGQKAPVIIRTKGHRLEGIWHTGSPMGMLINSMRGLHVCVPRNMTQAAGMYNTLFQGDDPALVIEVLSGYRIKEKVPDNVGTFTVPLGVPEVLRQGSDVTIATYGFCCEVARGAAEILEGYGVDVEIVDVQTLLPFDREGIVAESLSKTNALVCLDEDVPGGAAAYMFQQILEAGSGWESLDAPPTTITAKPNRSAYGTDGGYFTKPNVEDVVTGVYGIMRERDPAKFPPLSGPS